MKKKKKTSDLKNFGKIAEEMAFQKLDSSMLFYIPDKDLNSMEDQEILNSITKAYPEFYDGNSKANLKKIILKILEDKKFLKKILIYYDIDIFYLFKLIYKKYSDVFGSFNKLSTSFLKKIKSELKYKRYVGINRPKRLKTRKSKS